MLSWHSFDRIPQGTWKGLMQVKSLEFEYQKKIFLSVRGTLDNNIDKNMDNNLDKNLDNNLDKSLD